MSNKTTFHCAARIMETFTKGSNHRESHQRLYILIDMFTCLTFLVDVWNKLKLYRAWFTLLFDIRIYNLFNRPATYNVHK